MDVVSYDLDGQPRKIGRVIKVDGNDVTVRFYRDRATSLIVKHPDGYEFSLNPIPAVQRKVNEVDEAGRQEQQHIAAEGFQEKARRLVFEYIKSKLEKTDTHVTFAIDEVYVVWFAKTLQNWKALVSTTLPDQMYYEVTYDGDKKQTYIDAYKKWDNVCVPDADRPKKTEGYNGLMDDHGRTVDARAQVHDLPQRVRDMNLNPAGPDRHA